jgi:peroxiredoxin
MKNLFCRSIVALCFLVAGATTVRASVAEAPENVHPLASGSVAPSGDLTSLDGTTVTLSSVIRDKPTILIFYRGGWCPFCNRHLAELGQSYLELRQLGFQIVAVTPDDLTAIGATAEKQHILYHLFSDRKMAVTPSYGVAYRINAATAKDYKENGINLAPIPGEPDFWLPVPAAFVIGKDGIVKFVYFNPDPSVTISREQLVAAAKAAL